MTPHNEVLWPSWKKSYGVAVIRCAKCNHSYDYVQLIYDPAVNHKVQMCKNCAPQSPNV